ncbi:MAG: hypothetical protein AAF409_03865 [Pseudomonadota bacterium]
MKSQDIKSLVVTPEDDEDQVMSKILSALRRTGQMNVGNLIEEMHLFENEHAEMILGALLEREMIEEGKAGGTLRITDYGYKMADVFQKKMKS